MAKPALLDALETIKAAVGAAIAGANLTNKGQVFVGMPIGPEITKILSDNQAEYQVNVFPIAGAKNATRYPKNFQQLAPAPNGLIATIAPLNVVTFSGLITPELGEDSGLGGEDALGGEDVAIGAIYNVWVMLSGYPSVAAFVQTTLGMTLAQLATAMAAQIAALGLSGVTAAAGGAALTVTGANVKYANVGSSGTIAREISRIERMVQVSIWCSDPIVRLVIGEAIVESVGGAASLFFTMNNGSQLYCRYATDNLDESSENEYTVYVQNFVFECEYGIVQIVPAFQIEAVNVTESIANFSPATVILGGTN